ncbi:MAG: DUF3842 family protein [Synergistaceae bacterium]|nr:DUF3842 family protein [Synergistaceae bacterium]
MKIVIIDGQGGALGKSLITALKKILPAAPECEIMAIGTNSAATSVMLGAGADSAATGENPVKVACRDAQIIAGPVGIVVADSMFGEITPAMAASIGGSRARKILIPVNKCDISVVGSEDLPYSEYVRLASMMILDEVKRAALS